MGHVLLALLVRVGLGLILCLGESDGSNVAQIHDGDAAGDEPRDASALVREKLLLHVGKEVGWRAPCFLGEQWRVSQSSWSEEGVPVIDGDVECLAADEVTRLPHEVPLNTGRLLELDPRVERNVRDVVRRVSELQHARGFQVGATRKASQQAPLSILPGHRRVVRDPVEGSAALPRKLECGHVPEYLEHVPSVMTCQDQVPHFLGNGVAVDGERWRVRGDRNAHTRRQRGEADLDLFRQAVLELASEVPVPVEGARVFLEDEDEDARPGAFHAKVLGRVAVAHAVPRRRRLSALRTAHLSHRLPVHCRPRAREREGLVDLVEQRQARPSREWDGEDEAFEALCALDAG